MSIVLAGPYMGDFEQEVITFRPYVRWLADVAQYDHLYVSTHANRSFMYDFLPKDDLIPISEELSRDEYGQDGYVHTTVSTKDYQIHLKLIKDEIINREKCSRKDILVYGLAYVKSCPPLGTYNKKFIPIHSDVSIKEHLGKVVFIPDISESRVRLEKIKSYLDNNKIDYVIAGDLGTRFSNNNVVTNRIDYYENGWKYNIKLISSAKAVICPVSSWTTICNMQGVPVFSWGKHVGQHKYGGIYNFGNKKCFVFPVSLDTSEKIFVNMLEMFFKREVK